MLDLYSDYIESERLRALWLVHLELVVAVESQPELFGKRVTHWRHRSSRSILFIFYMIPCKNYECSNLLIKVIS